ncbi:MAG: RnfABCDGE type electron transport complex subunit D [Clostridiales bacterium]|nr:RnfABCDGE type electron transport complex subunit D [Clostridiales bacterium]
MTRVPKENVIVSSSPHLRHEDSTRGIMLDVLIALAPAAVAGIVLFGLRAAAVLAVTIVSALVCEWLCCKIRKIPNTLGDLSAVVTGLLLGMNLPVGLPLWMAAIGSGVAIVIVKQMFGGLGHNFANPAITGRIVLMVSFPTAMTTWVKPFDWMNKTDAVAAATPLAGSETTLRQLFLGLRGGCIGEVCAAALLVGGIYLLLRRVITPTAPLAFILTVGGMMWIFGENPLYQMMSGGLLLGAIFMATDYVTSPSGFKGQLIFGVGCGLITAVIRHFGSLPEGVSYSILLMNILTPYINRLTAPKPFGTVKEKKRKEAAGNAK